ncbi:MAG: hypothetical protein FWG70_08620 [Oscillospiraceae bacterium]|nr:hypothetical protein [Oscillospiraceae bacterium]
MKKIILFIAISLTVFITACDVKESTNETPREIPSNEQSIENIVNSGTEEPKDKALLSAISEFPLDSFTGLDGITISKTEATGFAGNILIFDFGYIREPSLEYLTTFNTPDLFDFDRLEFNEDFDSNVSINYIKAEKGDIINGFQVEAASFAVSVMNFEDENGDIYQEINVIECTVVFSGTHTITGVMYRVPTDPDYIDMGGDLLFYPDASSERFFPLPYSFTSFPTQVFDFDSRFALRGDTTRLFLGNEKDYANDIGEYFKESDYIQFEITVTDLAVMYHETGSARSGGKLSEYKIIN